MYALAPGQTVTKYPYNFTNLRMDNPQISFPSPPSEALLNSFNVYKVEDTPQPIFQKGRQKVVEDTPVREESGWCRVWKVIDLSAEEQEILAAQEGAVIRSMRDQKLKDSDWSQLPDAPVDKTAWAAYRQALRDVPSQVGFPWDVQWPVEP